MISKGILFSVETILPVAMLLANIIIIFGYLVAYRSDKKFYSWCPYFIFSSVAFLGVSAITLIMSLWTSVAPFNQTVAILLLTAQFGLGMIGCVLATCGAKTLMKIARNGGLRAAKS